MRHSVKNPLRMFEVFLKAYVISQVSQIYQFAKNNDQCRARTGDLVRTQIMLRTRDLTILDRDLQPTEH
jgi:hypothetical protein